jgi:hypothetical protein
MRCIFMMLGDMDNLTAWLCFKDLNAIELVHLKHVIIKY